MTMKGKLWKDERWKTNVFKKVGVVNYKGWIRVTSTPLQTCFSVTPDELSLIVPSGKRIDVYDMRKPTDKPKKFDTTGLTAAVSEMAVLDRFDDEVYTIACGTRDGMLAVFKLDTRFPRPTEADESQRGGLTPMFSPFRPEHPNAAEPTFCAFTSKASEGGNDLVLWGGCKSFVVIQLKKSVEDETMTQEIYSIIPAHKHSDDLVTTRLLAGELITRTADGELELIKATDQGALCMCDLSKAPNLTNS